MSSSSNPNQTSGNQPNPFFTHPQPSNAGNAVGNNQSQQPSFTFGGGNNNKTGVFNFTGSNQAGPGADQVAPRNSRFTAEERREHWQNKNPRYQSGFTTAIDVTPEGLVNKKTKRVEENSILIQPADPKKGNNQEIWSGYFTRTSGLKTIANRYISTHSPDTKTLALFITQPKPDPAQIMAEHVGLRLLPFKNDIVLTGQKRKADDRILCANCHKDTHVLADCVWPIHKRWGDIFGCPICNTKEHRFDLCHNQSSLNDWDRFKFLVLRRAGKCMIRSDCKVYNLALQFIREGKVNPAELVMPWTRPGAVVLFNQPEAIATLEAWDYQNPQAQVIVDPNSAPAALSGLAATTGGDFSAFSAASRQAEKEYKAQARQYLQAAQFGAPSQAGWSTQPPFPQPQATIPQPQAPVPQPQAPVPQQQDSRPPRKVAKAKGHNPSSVTQRQKASLDVTMADDTNARVSP
ncbi:hypothetical protein F4813DRAFT_397696 [Daldinia decipiens]|uniref:uncharacterized protein n=1 Tax=Daldinia decipiens TaxID=326647 RepID=UPI0020C419E4|nr:uncharacterized protein F4813DRAFT_397696 [Daldinia decipiens]KAI1656301.1 hypothetical protein F4813DRAFT_397696 [Daldinia decipiens]